MSAFFVNQFGMISQVKDTNVLDPEVMKAIKELLPQPIAEEIEEINRPVIGASFGAIMAGTYTNRGSTSSFGASLLPYNT